MQIGDLVGSRYHFIRGIVVEAGSNPDPDSGFAVRVKWFDGDESIEWVKYLEVISESR
jgi:hypothetical protein